MRESDLLHHLYNRTRGMPQRWPSVVVGPGDDAAVVRAEQGGLLLVTVDQLVEHRHFKPFPATPIDLIARKVVARSVSDIAAMGGNTRGGWGLATGVLPPRFAHGAELTDALHRWAEHWHFPMVGGDVATGPDGGALVLTVTIAGTPHAARGPVLRSTARPGDSVWVTGTVGGSLDRSGGGRHLCFEPRLVESGWLCDQVGGDLHAMIDLSDGLGRDAGRIAEASTVRIELDAKSLPRSAGVDIEQALADGEDYELLFTVAPGIALPASTPNGTRLTCVGRVTEGAGCVVRIGSQTRDASQLGWDH